MNQRWAAVVLAALLLAACDPATAEDLRATEQAAAEQAAAEQAAAEQAAAEQAAAEQATTTTAAPAPSSTTTVASPSTSPTSPSTTATTSTVPARWEHRVALPVRRPPQLPGAGEYLGSGCSPGSSSLPDGIWIGEITQAFRGAIEFDLMCVTTPDDHGTSWRHNDSDLIRGVPVDPRALVYRWVDRPNGPPIAYEDWYDAPDAGGSCPPQGCWDVWIYVNDGAVTEIVQLRIGS